MCFILSFNFKKFSNSLVLPACPMSRHKFNLVYAPFGAGAYFLQGHPFPEDTKRVCDGADAIIKGPIGLALSEMKKIPTEMSPEGAALLPLRKRFDTYANYRPVILPKSCAEFSPLRPEIIGEGLDILMMIKLHLQLIGID